MELIPLLAWIVFGFVGAILTGGFDFSSTR